MAFSIQAAFFTLVIIALTLQLFVPRLRRQNNQGEQIAFALMAEWGIVALTSLLLSAAQAAKLPLEPADLHEVYASPSAIIVIGIVMAGVTILTIRGQFQGETLPRWGKYVFIGMLAAMSITAGVVAYNL